MTYVYIGNATKQALQFAYRLPERKAPITQHVPVGGQKRLTEDMSQLDIDAIFEQWGKYGLTKVEELDSRRGSFDGYLISVGKPMTQDKMQRAAKYREAVLDARGRKTREEAALAMINTIERESNTIAKNYEVSVAEIEPSTGFTNPDDHHVAEGWRADRDQRPDMPPTPVPSRRRRTKGVQL
jgi:hypothetical protein